MIGRLNHVAIAVPDVEAAGAIYRDTLGFKLSAIMTLPEHGVRVVFVELANSKVELMQPYSDDSPLIGFLAKNPQGAIHHLCYEVEDIEKAREHLLAKGMRVLGDGSVKIGAHGKPVLFLHPKDFFGTLIELEQIRNGSD